MNMLSVGWRDFSDHHANEWRDFCKIARTAVSSGVFDVEARTAVSSGVFDVEARTAISSDVFDGRTTDEGRTGQGTGNGDS